MSQPRTIIDKLWEPHVIAERPGGDALLWIDRHYLHEGSFLAFDDIALRGERVAAPSLTFAIADHYVPVRAGHVAKPAIQRMVTDLEANCNAHGITFIGRDDPRQGIVHVIGPEQGLSLPGFTIVCGDSHTSTNGALGAYAFGIGASEVAHVLMTQTLWQKRPKRMRITIDGRLGPGVAAKDVILSIIAKIGADGARGHAIEYAGQVVRGLDMGGRMTICNMSVEAGGRLGIVAPDAVTFAYIKGKRYAPKGTDFDAAAVGWAGLASDTGAVFEREISLDGDDVVPVVTWGTSPEDTLPVTASVPDPARISDPTRAAHVAAALGYMGLAGGQPLAGVPIDRAFIGSCTNARSEDLRAVAAVLSGRRVKVPVLIAPGSRLIKQQAEQEGLDRIFIDAGAEWADSGCSMCVGINGDIVPAGERCASTSNRNFKGRQGPGSRTHLMSPAMAAAAAVAGHLADVRPMLAGRTA